MNGDFHLAWGAARRQAAADESRARILVAAARQAVAAWHAAQLRYDSGEITRAEYHAARRAALAAVEAAAVRS